MHQCAYGLGQQAERIQGLGPAFGMREVSRKPVGAEHRQPVQSVVHAPAGFIGMGHWRRDECVANRGDGASRRAVATRTARWRVPGEIARPASSWSIPAVRW